MILLLPTIRACMCMCMCKPAVTVCQTVSPRIVLGVRVTVLRPTLQDSVTRAFDWPRLEREDQSTAAVTVNISLSCRAIGSGASGTASGA